MVDQWIEWAALFFDKPHTVSLVGDVVSHSEGCSSSPKWIHCTVLGTHIPAMEVMYHCGDITGSPVIPPWQPQVLPLLQLLRPRLLLVSRCGCDVWWFLAARTDGKDIIRHLFPNCPVLFVSWWCFFVSVSTFAWRSQRSQRQETPDLKSERPKLSQEELPWYPDSVIG